MSILNQPVPHFSSEIVVLARMTDKDPGHHISINRGHDSQASPPYSHTQPGIQVLVWFSLSRVPEEPAGAVSKVVPEVVDDVLVAGRRPRH